MKIIYVVLVLLPLFTVGFFSCQAQSNKQTPYPDALPAPDIHTTFGWVNTDKAYTLKDFRGKIVLLDFWTFGCINCQHIIPDLKKLEAEYPNELVVIGVHSAKFRAEKATATIQKAIAKFGIEHPVVNDAAFSVWQSYGVNAWPTVALISPDGKLLGKHAGEGVYEVLKPAIEQLMQQYDKQLNRNPITFKLNKEEITGLRFPSKLMGQENFIWVANSGQHSIIKIDENGKVLEKIGNGKQGFSDGSFEEATFYEPHGLALKGHRLYIADTKNNAIRVADLQARTVKTIAGDGELDYYFLDERWNEPVKPNSPWDLLMDGEEMYIANAGNHQILKMDLETHVVTRFAGSGREALQNGTLRTSSFNQPSGLAKLGNTLFVADAEASAIRSIDLSKQTVQTQLGKGLFDFGDKDGNADKALLQHAVGVEAYENSLYIADTYNGKIKLVDLQQKKVRTIASGFQEPNDLLILNGYLWISDTNNHQLIKINLKTNDKIVVKVIPAL